MKSRSRRPATKKRARSVSVTPAARADIELLRLARTIIRRMGKADARSKPRLLGAYRLLVGNDVELLKIAQAGKKSGRPTGPSPATRLARLVWVARRRYPAPIPFSAIEDAVNHDAKWVRTRVRQTDEAIAAKMFDPDRAFQYDRLPPQQRRERILADLHVLAEREKARLRAEREARARRARTQ